MKKNEEIKKELENKLENLVDEQNTLSNILGISLDNKEQRQDFINALEEDPQKTLALVNYLLEAIIEQGQENNELKKSVEVYQFATQEAYIKVNRRRARRVSLGGEKNETDTSFLNSDSYQQSPISTPRTPRTPRFSPASPLTPTLDTNSENLENVLEEIVFANELYQEEAEEKIIDLSSDINTLQHMVRELKKQNDSKEREILWLEEERTNYQKAEEKNKQLSNEKSKLTAYLQEKDTKINQLELELRETNNDFLQASENNISLNELLSQRETELSEVNQQLFQQMGELEYLKKNYNDTTLALEEKMRKLVENNRLAESEKEQLQRIIVERENQYQQEKNDREANFQKQLNNLRNFHIDSSVVADTTNYLTRPLKRSHSYSLSATNSPFFETRNNAKPSPSSLFHELVKNSDSGIANKDYFTLHSSDISKVNKRNSDSFYFSPNNYDFQRSENKLQDVIDDVFSTIESMGSSTEEESVADLPYTNSELELLTKENQELSKNLHELEKSWKELHDSKVGLERVLKEINEKNLLKEHENESLTSELNENKYFLAEARSKNRQFQWKLDELNNDYYDLENAWELIEQEINNFLILYNIKLNIEQNTMENEKKIKELTTKITNYQKMLQQLKTSAEEIKQKQTEAENELREVLKELGETKEQVKKLQDEKAEEEEKIDRELDLAIEEAEKLEAQILVLSNSLK